MTNNDNGGRHIKNNKYEFSIINTDFQAFLCLRGSSDRSYDYTSLHPLRPKYTI